MEKVIKDNWNDILSIMNDRGTSQPVITAWLKPLELYKIENGVIYFLVNNDQRAILTLLPLSFFLIMKTLIRIVILMSI